MGNGEKMKEVATFSVNVPIVIKKKGDVFVACCPVLDVWSQGDSLTEAKKNIEEALRLFITTCYERGTLDAAMKECGWTVRKKTAKLLAAHGYVNVPIPFNVTGCHSVAACHA